MKIKLKELRKQKDLTIDELAKIVNVANSSLCEIERGRQEPRLGTLIKLADYFDISLDELVGRERKGDKR